MRTLGSFARSIAAGALLTGLAAGGPVAAQVLRGGEIRLSRLNGHAKGGTDVAVAPNGDFVAVWRERTLSPTGPIEIRARRFRADGSVKGTDQVVATLTRDAIPYSAPQVAVDAAGRFLVVWEEPGTPHLAPLALVFGRRFEASGRPLGPRFALEETTENGQFLPDVAMTGDGRAVVAWANVSNREDPEGFLILDVHVRRLDAAGRFAGAGLIAAKGGQSGRLAMRPDGAFAIASEVYSGEPSFYDIHLSLYSANGELLREAFEITSGDTETASQVDPAIAIAKDGRMLVTWTDFAIDLDLPGADAFSDALGVVGQLLTADGTPVGGNFRINDVRRGKQEESTVAANRSGGFLVAWQSAADQDGGGIDIFERPISADGRKLGLETRVNLSRAGDQIKAVLSLASNGRGLAAWSGPSAQGSVDIFARRLAPPEP